MIAILDIQHLYSLLLIAQASVRMNEQAPAPTKTPPPLEADGVRDDPAEPVKSVKSPVPVEEDPSL